jgi:hypothetical protein
VHGIYSYDGDPSHNRDRMRTFGYEGDVSGVDITNNAFYEEPLVITVDVVMPGTLKRVQQLMSNEPTDASLGHFTVKSVQDHFRVARYVLGTLDNNGL